MAPRLDCSSIAYIQGPSRRSDLHNRARAFMAKSYGRGENEVCTPLITSERPRLFVESYLLSFRDHRSVSLSRIFLSEQRGPLRPMGPSIRDRSFL